MLICNVYMLCASEFYDKVNYMIEDTFKSLRYYYFAKVHF